MPVYTACRLSALQPERGLPVRVGGTDVAVFLVGGEVRAVEDHCLHLGGPLADGLVVDGCVVCPWHGWVYELATGRKVVGARTAGDLPVYAVTVDGDEVKVEIPDGMRT
ncbi:MAG: nitrite reductase small subunit [Acidimicrobiaceae bacterium]|nr:nitrite reductase small subunit [Acidimicrobiaceae bacterium]MDQ1445893.1 nitrite reductase small subunit [Acidimicrobiaceae bacterium]